MPSIARCVLIATLCAVLVGCTENVGRDELVGTYSVHNREGRALLTLRPDMTFRQVITFNGGKSKEASGSWKYDPQNHMVILLDAFSVTGNSLDLHVNAVGMPVMKVFGQIEMGADPDAGIKYVRQ